MFALQDELASNLKLRSVHVEPLETDTGTAKFDLTMTVVESAGTLKFNAEYNTELFEQGTIQRLLRHFEQLCQAAVAHPESRLCELGLLTPPERDQVLNQWNATEKEYPRHTSVQELFDEQADQNPEATAIVFQKRRIQYQELNRRANQLAHYLCRLGVGPGSRVGI